MSDLLNLKERLPTADIEKSFNSVNHNFLLIVLENYGFSQDFLKWISFYLSIYFGSKSGIVRYKWW